MHAWNNVTILLYYMQIFATVQQVQSVYTKIFRNVTYLQTIIRIWEHIIFPEPTAQSAVLCPLRIPGRLRVLIALGHSHATAKSSSFITWTIFDVSCCKQFIFANFNFAKIKTFFRFELENALKPFIQ